jgi:hypothetical protein
MTSTNPGDMAKIFRRYGSRMRRYGRMRKIASLFGFEKVWFFKGLNK